ncbi:MAG: TetR/AcrR family transcriptional regulator [Faecalibacterium sp.]|nr:TetR/AcrR family transcriptional regulator [Faecalibacterium sp.]
MYTNHTNPIALANQERICRALLQLMQQKHFSRINVSELCRAAELERVTFYRHFDEKVDVIRYYLDRQMTQLISSLPRQSTLERNLTVLFEWAYKERDNLNALFDSHMTMQLSQSLQKRVFSILSANLSAEERSRLPVFPYAADDPYVNGAVLGTILGLLSVWRTEEYREPPHSLALHALAVFGFGKELPI